MVGVYVPSAVLGTNPHTPGKQMTCTVSMDDTFCICKTVVHLGLQAMWGRNRRYFV